MRSNTLVRVVDDDISVRRAMAFTLEGAGYRVATFESGIEFLGAAVDPLPGCVVLDYRMPGMDGLEVQRELRARGIDIPVVVITGHGDTQVASSAVADGAMDFIEKPFTCDALLKSVAAALRSSRDASTIVGPDQPAKARMASSAETAAAAQARMRRASLTVREQQVLEILADGLSNKAVARKLDISPRTAESHRANIFRKIGAAGLAEALALTAIPAGASVRIGKKRQTN